MDKKTFYQQLSEKLTELGVSDDYINRHLKQFDGYFAGKSDEEVAKEIEKLGDMDRVAARIKRMTDKIIQAEQSEQEEGEPARKEPSPAEAVKEESAPAVSSNRATGVPSAKGQPGAERADVSAAPVEKKPEGEKKAEETPGRKEAEERAIRREREELMLRMPGATGVTPSQKQRRTVEEAATGAGKPAQEDEVAAPVKRSKLADDDFVDLDRISHTPPDPETIRKNTRKFWILFAVTLPVTIAVLLAGGFLFAFLFFLIAVLIIASVALLVAITAVGTLLSVFGLIFGVAQMISSMPIGLYECGLSIIIGSGALFCGILVYNFAVRLMPFAAKWLLVLLKFVIKKLRELYIYLKKECIGQ